MTLMKKLHTQLNSALRQMIFYLWDNLYNYKIKKVKIIK